MFVTSLCQLSGRTALLALGVWAGSILPVSGQIAQPHEAASLQWGLLALYPSLKVADAGIDDNVFNDAELPESDFTLTAISRMIGVLRLGSNDLMMSAGSDYVWFRDHAAERSSNTVYALRFNLSASRFKPFVGAELLNTRARATPEIDARAQRTERLAIFGANVNLTHRTSLTASAQWDDSRFDDTERFRGVNLADPLNRRGRSYTAGVRYATTAFTTVALNANVRRKDFLRSNRRDFTAYSVMPSVEFAPEAIIRGRFSAGYEVLRPEDPALHEGRGAVLEGSLGWAVAATTVFDLTAGRSVNYSFDDEEPLFRQTSVRLHVSRPIFGPVGVQAAAEHQRLAYDWQPGGLRDFDERVDTWNTLTAGITFPVGGDIAGVIGAERSQRRSPHDARRNFTRTRLVSTITISK